MMMVVTTTDRTFHRTIRKNSHLDPNNPPQISQGQMVRGFPLASWRWPAIWVCLFGMSLVTADLRTDPFTLRVAWADVASVSSFACSVRMTARRRC